MGDEKMGPTGKVEVIGSYRETEDRAYLFRLLLWSRDTAFRKSHCAMPVSYKYASCIKLRPEYIQYYFLRAESPAPELANHELRLPESAFFRTDIRSIHLF